MHIEKLIAFKWNGCPNEVRKSPLIVIFVSKLKGIALGRKINLKPLDGLKIPRQKPWVKVRIDLNLDMSPNQTKRHAAKRYGIDSLVGLCGILVNPSRIYVSKRGIENR